jgi:hypothetical protein
LRRAAIAFSEGRNSGVDVDHRHRLRAGQAQRLRLDVAAVEDLRPHRVRHLDEQVVACLVCHVAFGDDVAEEDLDVDLVV